MWQIREYDMKKFWDKDYENMKLLREVKELPDHKTILEIDGKTYRWCASSHQDKVHGVKEVIMNHEAEEEAYGDFKCPYCGSVYEEAWELPDEDDTWCRTCGSDIEYERHVEVSYTVIPVKMAPIVTI